MLDNLGYPGRTVGCETTIWTDIAAGGRNDAAALERVLKRYYLPLRYHIARKFQVDDPSAEDLLHDFSQATDHITKLMRAASRDRGRFRTFLFRALDNFVRSEFRKQAAAKRCPRGGFVPLDTIPESAATQDFTETESWAATIIQQTCLLMAAECKQQNCERRWKIFEMRLLTPILEGAAPPPYEVLIASLGFQSPAEAANTLITAKRMFGRILRQVVAEYVGDGEEVDEELRQLRLELVQEKVSVR